MKPTRKKILHVKRLTVYLSKDLDRRIRDQARSEDRPISTVAERAFRGYLELTGGGARQ
jgi:predicted transcriptional regulator